jgi:hypothetical protein
MVQVESNPALLELGSGEGGDRSECSSTQGAQMLHPGCLDMCGRGLALIGDRTINPRDERAVFGETGRFDPPRRIPELRCAPRVGETARNPRPGARGMPIFPMHHEIDATIDGESFHSLFGARGPASRRLRRLKRSKP